VKVYVGRLTLDGIGTAIKAEGEKTVLYQKRWRSWVKGWPEVGTWEQKGKKGEREEVISGK